MSKAAPMATTGKSASNFTPPILFGLLICIPLLAVGLTEKIIFLGVLGALGLWVVEGWIGYLIGKPKHREDIGMVLGLVFGLIGWIITAILPAGQPPDPNPETLRGLHDRHDPRGKGGQAAPGPTETAPEPTETAPEATETAPEPTETASDPALRLRKLQELSDAGLMTQDEYKTKRTEIIKSI
jgi:hypothetical protein